MRKIPLKASAKQKGDALEDAVHAIEHTLLSSFPGLAQETFRIQSNRIINSDGVRHEIDIFVTADFPNGYESTFIFECKNWQAKVGKNEIIVFTEKIAAVSAQRGFFIAQAFTKDALAQAAKNSRLKLLIASHIQPITTVKFPQLVYSHVGETTVNVKFGVPDFSKTPLATRSDLCDGTIVVENEAMNTSEYISRWVNTIRSDEIGRMDISQLHDGDHIVNFSTELQFALGKAYLDGFSLLKISLEGLAKVTLVRAQIFSIYDIETRGRLLKIGMDCEGIEIRADIVEKDAEKLIPAVIKS